LSTVAFPSFVKNGRNINAAISCGQGSKSTEVSQQRFCLAAVVFTTWQIFLLSGADMAWKKKPVAQTAGGRAVTATFSRTVGCMVRKLPGKSENARRSKA
jgi:hypothetical protein